MNELHEPYPLTEAQIQQFREDGFIKLKNVFSKVAFDKYAPTITRLVHEENRLAGLPMEERTTYQQAFIQVGNLWRKDETAKEFSFSKRLARIATELMGTRGTRMYHDQALYKEESGGFTPWHADQQYWPLASAKSVTAWVPFQPVPVEMGPLCFGKGSHIKNIGRDLEISDESEALIRQLIRENGIVEVLEPFECGEVSFHTGWTLHRAGPNTSGRPREVHTVIFMDIDMKLAEPKNENQVNDRNAFAPGIEVGEIMATEMNPVLYEVPSE
ncbi:MAG: phytanoyl-CoA dioxygenase family protein [Planctomycetota bacterium]|jgi:ectoine hydroxylase-related dioxygenase (phytanoyl-CoA dioxygenase family)|nr:phytanoyl-CoA dioxygenase family protein [Planctomycetota bacterium]MDP7251082.1 phytanoyl-CoA dioxygenase family protein [Planctomycetota bacterium]